MTLIEKLFKEIKTDDRESSRIKRIREGVIIWSRHYMGVKYSKYVENVYQGVLASLYSNKDKINLDNLGEYYMEAIKHCCNLCKKKDKSIWKYEKTFLLNDDKIVH